MLKAIHAGFVAKNLARNLICKSMKGFIQETSPTDVVIA
jgi:hypothetical protein